MEVDPHTLSFWKRDLLLRWDDILTFSSCRTWRRGYLRGDYRVELDFGMHGLADYFFTRLGRYQNHSENIDHINGRKQNLEHKMIFIEEEIISIYDYPKVVS